MSKLSKLLFLFAAISLLSFVVIRLLIGGWVPFLWLALGLTLVFFISAIVNDRAFFKEFLSLRTTRKGMSMGAMILMVLVSLSAINILGSRHYTTWDFSLNQVNSLSEQSVQLAKSLTQELKVIYFYQEGAEGVAQNKRMFIDLIRKYQDVNSKINLDFVEVNERPDLAQKYNIAKGTQSVLLDYQGRTNLIEKIDEQEITGALAKVTRDKEKKILVISGHGEASLEVEKDGRSLSALKSLLEGNRYKVEPFSFTQAAAIPTDADVVIVAGPRQPYFDFEIKALEDYLQRGGALIINLEPGNQAGLQDFMAKQLGLKIESNVIVTVLDTPMGRAVDPRFTRGTDFSNQSQITKPFGRNQVTVFRVPQSISRIDKEREGVEYFEVVKTNHQSMGFKDLDFKSEGQPGPFTLAYEVKKKDGFHALVVGDEDWMTNQLLYQNLNRDLALNAVSALAKEDNLISISPKEVTATKMELTDTQFLVMIFTLVVPLPLMMYAFSLFFWYRRRNA